jgi:hypothetical protein
LCSGLLGLCTQATGNEAMAPRVTAKTSLRTRGWGRFAIGTWVRSPLQGSGANKWQVIHVCALVRAHRWGHSSGR